MTFEETLADAISVAVTVRQGDTLVIGLNQTVEPPMLDWMMAQLHDRLTGVRVLVVTDVEAMAVQRGGDVDPGAGLS